MKLFFPYQYRNLSTQLSTKLDRHIKTKKIVFSRKCNRFNNLKKKYLKFELYLGLFDIKHRHRKAFIIIVIFIELLNS